MVEETKEIEVPDEAETEEVIENQRQRLKLLPIILLKNTLKKTLTKLIKKLYKNIINIALHNKLIKMLLILLMDKLKMKHKFLNRIK